MVSFISTIGLAPSNSLTKLIYHEARTTCQFDLWSVDGETDCRDSLLTNSIQTYGR